MGVIVKEESEFEVVCLPHIDAIYEAALRYTGNSHEAQDLTQDVYLRAYRFFEKFRPGTSAKAWLFKILKNAFINMRRASLKTPFPSNIKDFEALQCKLIDGKTPEEEIFGDLFSDPVDAAIQALLWKYREVILLFDVEGLSYKEIADQLGCPIGTVMSRLYRGRGLLRKSLSGYAQKNGYIVKD